MLYEDLRLRQSRPPTLLIYLVLGVMLYMKYDHAILPLLTI
jgi:hypothetical protein